LRTSWTSTAYLHNCDEKLIASFGIEADDIRSSLPLCDVKIRVKIRGSDLS
jgi:hypothetical protein